MTEKISLINIHKKEGDVIELVKGEVITEHTSTYIVYVYIDGTRENSVEMKKTGSLIDGIELRSGASGCVNGCSLIQSSKQGRKSSHENADREESVSVFLCS